MNRILWVDIAKGIAIIAVVLLHISHLYPGNGILPITELLGGLWHVPVFFIIGGFFVKEERLLQPISFIRGKFNSLYLLILKIYIPVLLLHNVCLCIGFYDVTIDYDGKNVTWWGLAEFAKNIFMAIIFAGREPILGAMWFVYVLFMALCGLSVISFIIKKAIKDKTKYEFCRFVVVLSLAILSCTLTNEFDFTIPRGNNTLTAIWLIYIGMMVAQKLKLNFNNKYVAIGSLLLAWHSATMLGGVSLNSNSYTDVVSLTIASLACLYVICYFSKKMERTIGGRILSFIGTESFYIMGLHFIAFKIMALMLGQIGIEQNPAVLMPQTGTSILLLFIYLIGGVMLPLLFIYLLRLLKRITIRCKEKIAVH